MPRLQIERGTLCQLTLQLLQQTERTPVAIYNATGINPHWLSSFKQGRIQQPSVNRIQVLYEYLSGKELRIS